MQLFTLSQLLACGGAFTYYLSVFDRDTGWMGIYLFISLCGKVGANVFIKLFRLDGQLNIIIQFPES